MTMFNVKLDGFDRTVRVPLIRFQTTVALRLMAQAIKDGIIERAGRGVDSMLAPFVPYAGLTLELKSHRGQRLDPPSLRDTGQMLDGIRYANRTLKPGDAESEARAMKHQWGGVGDMGHVIPQRRFFDARPEDIRNGEIMIARALTSGSPQGTDV